MANIRKRCGAALAAIAVALVVGGAAARGAQCAGDCDGSGAVTAEELEAGMHLIFDPAPRGACTTASFDVDSDGRVLAHELIAAIYAAARGWATSTPTSSPTPSATPSVTTSPTPSLTPTAAFFFRDVTEAAGVSYEPSYADSTDPSHLAAGGVAAGDYDGDGWTDLYVAGGTAPNHLFRNRRDGTFADLTDSAHVAAGGGSTSGPVFGDVDGDGFPDLFVGGIDGSVPRLFHNQGNGEFAETTDTAGLAIAYNSIGAAFGDYDGDGDADLFIAHWKTQRAVAATVTHLWRNDGGGVFTPIDDASAGIAFNGGALSQDTSDLTFAPTFADINNDGWQDLLVTSDSGTTRTFLNNKDGTFSAINLGRLTDENAMGSAVADFDNDGALDWFVTGIFEPSGVASGGWGVSGNRLYHNHGDGMFSDVTDAAGVRDGGWGWAACAADFNNDGLLDLFHVNGWPQDEAAEFHDDASRLFIANPDGSFTERAAELGIDDRRQGRGVACFDYDRDGDIDIFIANNGQPPRLYRNERGNRLNYLDVTLRGRAPNTQSLGARIAVTVGAQTQLRELHAGSNYVSQDPLEAHFGLGHAEFADTVRITWPTGEHVVYGGVSANQMLVVDQPMGGSGSP